MKLKVSLTDAGRNWCASASDGRIGGTVVATGKTHDLAIKKFQSALKFHLDGLREDGQSLANANEIELLELVGTTS